MIELRLASRSGTHAAAGCSECQVTCATVGKNAFDGYQPSVPDGEKLDYGSTACNELETMGERPLSDTTMLSLAIV